MITPPLKKDSCGVVSKRRLPLISAQEKAQAIALVNTGMTMKDASRSLGISYASVKRIIKAYRKQGFKSINRKVNVSPRKISEEIRKTIIGMVEKNRKLSPAAVIERLKEMFPGFDCSTKTIQRVLVKDGLHGRVCVKNHCCAQ